LNGNINRFCLWLAILPDTLQVDFRYLPLQRLTRFSYHLTQSITREKNYFLTNLFWKFNTIQQDEALSTLFEVTSEALIPWLQLKLLKMLPVMPIV